MAHELTAAVDLDGRGEDSTTACEEALGVEGGGAGEDAMRHEPADRVDGAGQPKRRRRFDA